MAVSEEECERGVGRSWGVWVVAGVLVTLDMFGSLGRMCFFGAREISYHFADNFWRNLSRMAGINPVGSAWPSVKKR